MPLPDFNNQDDINTVNSNETSVLQTREEEEQIQELPSIRYQFSFVLEEVTTTQLQDD